MKWIYNSRNTSFYGDVKKEDIKPTDVPEYFDVMYANAPRMLGVSDFKIGCYVVSNYNSMREWNGNSMTPARRANHDLWRLMFVMQ